MPNPNPATRTNAFPDPYCPDCGSEFACNCDELDGDTCYECGGEAYVEADCFEDTCCCADPETSHGFIVCPNCGGK